MSISKSAETWGGVAAACLLLAAPAGAAEGDDDLALVKRAVASAGQTETLESADESPARRRSEERRVPTWLKVSIVDEGDDGASLSISLPLALVRAIDDIACDDEDRDRGASLSDLLAELVSGQPLVSIDGDDAEVRVWME